MSEESLKNKTIKGVGWSAVDNVLVLLIINMIIYHHRFYCVLVVIIKVGFNMILIRKIAMSIKNKNLLYQW